MLSNKRGQKLSQRGATWQPYVLVVLALSIVTVPACTVPTPVLRIYEGPDRSLDQVAVIVTEKHLFIGTMDEKTVRLPIADVFTSPAS
jgi:hypothetical protein